MSDGDVIRRPRVEDLFAIKSAVVERMSTILRLETEVRDGLEPIGGYPPFRVEWDRFSTTDQDLSRSVDVYCWRYVVSLLHLQRYMLCTEYQRVLKEIDEGRAPPFNPENVRSWIAGLKSMIHENVRTMLKSVFDNIVSGHYWTGRDKKKRCNDGVDRSFILTTNDYYYMYAYGYWQSDKPTITDDLEKACYILDGKDLPEQTLKRRMSADKLRIGSCSYFTIKVCKNGNTHYTMKEETRRALNRIGPDGNLLGEKVRIKIFDDGGWAEWRR